MAKAPKAPPADEAVVEDVDVDAMDDKDFAKFKDGMRGDAPAKEPEKVEEKVEEAPPPAEKPEPETVEPVVEDDDDDEVVDAKPGDTVPHGKFHRANERRKQEEMLRKAAETRATDAERREQERAMQMARLEERTNTLLQIAQRGGAEEDDDKVPSREDDPLAYLEYLESRFAKIEGEQTQRQRAEADQRAWGAAYATYNADLQRLGSEKPELKDAMNFLAESRRKELALFGVTDPAQQTADLNQTEQQIIAFAMQNRRSPAELMLQIATERGFAPKPPATNSNGTAPTTKVRDPKAAIEKIEMQEQTRQAATSLGSGSGAPVNTGDIGPQDIVDMSDEEFAEYKKKFGAKAMRRAFGVN